jgi:uracil-DNA glycosylase family protein
VTRPPKPTADSAEPFVPDSSSLKTLREAADGCRGCPLFANATQAVFGEGRKGARVLFVGEQPGNEEDLEGRPFVGPAGRILDEGLAAAGIDRDTVYVTNAVKHFKWIPKGTKRLHAKPSPREVRACAPWLAKEIEVVRPEVIACLGATASQALLGSSFKVTQQRGRVLASPLAERVVATIHPSAILRQRTSEDRRREMEAFVADLKVVAKLLR